MFTVCSGTDPHRPAVVVDLVIASRKISLHVRCNEACELMQVVVRRNHVDDMFHMHMRLSASGEDCPL